MTISDEAVEAAARAYYQGPNWDDLADWYKQQNLDYARAALEAAAPFIRAQALEDAADEFHARLPDGTGNGRAYNSHQVARMLRARAAAERGGE